MVDRPTILTVGEHALPLPVYFPSISSVKTTLGLQEYLHILSSLAGVNNQFLLSAFDLSCIDTQQQVKILLEASRQAGIITLMDSGNYESFWKDAQNEWTQDRFHMMLDMFPCDLAFNFDAQNPPCDINDHIDLIVKRLQADQSSAKNCQVIPIIHASPIYLPTLCAMLADQTGVSILAVPERRLGAGLLERACTVQAIRTALNNLGRYVALHLLGTGNPISITIYSASGADSFDGLEWCQTVVDYETGLLYHFSQADFFAGQTEWGDANLSFQARTLAHNLEFFSNWMQRLQNAMKRDQLVDFCRLNLPSRIYQHCADIICWK